MKILIAGAHGQLGTQLCRQVEGLGWPFMAVDRDALDIADRSAVRAAVRAYMPDAVVNAAAYTAVDKAETEIEPAFSVNRDGPENLAVACADLGIPLVHISTDYVFDGRKQGAYTEDDAMVPLGVYGRSKAEGEMAVRHLCPKHLILRTSWVFSAHGHNFVRTMLRLGSEREELGVVDDQFGKPTSASEIARLILFTLSQAEGRWGTYHLAQPEVTSWHGFAQAIFVEAERLGWPLRVKQVNPISTEEYPTPARRPANSELNCGKLEASFGVRIRPWKESLGEVIEELRHG